MSLDEFLDLLNLPGWLIALIVWAMVFLPIYFLFL